MLEDFTQRGIDVVAVSSNTREIAEKTVETWGIEKLPVAYGLTLEDAERWGLFVSAGLSDAEPDRFTEPGTFLVRANGTLYASIVQTMPFTRTPASNLLNSMEWILQNDYPARGEVG